MSSPATSYTPPVTPSDDEVLVRVEGVSKKFCRSLKKSLWYGVCDIGAELNPFRRRVAEVAGSELRVAREEAEVAGSELLVASGNTSAEGASGPATSYPPLVTSQTGEAWLRDGEFWAVKDVSFELRRGECLGLIGHNGAGKTTLLKMLNGLIKPDRGTITMRGRVGALIALGAGFNPILTGRENIYINGSVLGLTKNEIEEKIDEIIDFAEIREFIDMPVQSYSSGMSVRLGFAVAANLEPDVLILDEVLAVGDIKFRNKCYDKIGSLIKKSAVILVTHNMNHVTTICTKCIVVKKGIATEYKQVEDGVNELEKQMQSNEKEKGFEYCKYPFNICSISKIKESLNQGDNFEIEVTIENEIAIGKLSLRLLLYNSEKTALIDWWSDRHDLSLSLVKGKNIIKINTGPIYLKQGKYGIHIVIRDSSGLESLFCSYLKYHVYIIGKSIGCNYHMPKGNLEILSI
jgi:lipopolysaccharide transport system ATP-binding protein